MKTVISFSGGKTSAYMTKMLIELPSIDPVILFANTGQEHDETLIFVDRCAKEWGIDVIWLEAVVYQDERKGCTHKIVDFETADRSGRVFENMIKKYGIPNKAYPHCTRELKLNPIYSYLRERCIDDYQMAIGIRVDEQRRAIAKEKRGNIFYPLIDTWPNTKQMINDWWASQSFNLPIHEFEGNCTWCWKKSMKKHFALIKSQPEVFNFPRLMERRHGVAGHNEDGTPRVFFRGNLSAVDIFDIYNDVTNAQPEFDFDCDDGCGDSCDIHAEMAVDQCSGF